jgi:Tat protein translocase TatB subunit
VFNIGPDKLIVLFILALIVLGPKRLPDAARTVGRVVGELRRMSGSFQKEVQEALADPKDALTSAVGDLRNEFGDFNTGLGEVRSGFMDLSGVMTNRPTDVTPPASPAVPAPTNLPLPPSPDDPSLN